MERLKTQKIVNEITNTRPLTLKTSHWLEAHKIDGTKKGNAECCTTESIREQKKGIRRCVDELCVKATGIKMRE